MGDAGAVWRDKYGEEVARKDGFRCFARDRDAEAEPAKHDAGKLRYDLIPPESLDAVVQVLTFGAGKYGDRNWEGGLGYGRIFAACMRHLWAWWRGESWDTESNLSHLAHAACCIFFLISYETRGVGDDDRMAGEVKKD